MTGNQTRPLRARAGWQGWRHMVAAAVAGAGLLAWPALSWGFAGIFDASTQKALQGIGGSLMDAKPPAPALPSVSGMAPRGRGGEAAGEKPVAKADAGAGARGDAQADAGAFKYSQRVSAQVRDDVIQELVNLGKRNGGLDAAGEKQLREALGKVDIAKSIGGALQAKGYPQHSLATATAFWLVVNYEIVHGVQATDTQNAAVLRQMQQRMAATSDVARMSDAQKQRAAEGMMWFATLQHQHNEQARQGAPGYALQTVQADAREALKTFGIDADQLKLTDQGLVPR
ncbi:MAG: hypothetical protein Q4G71_05520 [Pseudomonadota bacterium]|nr:hypothetical protein [Pseudomonadota bacterium]